MSQQRLDDLAILNIERQFSAKIQDNLDELVVKFAMAHGNSRIVLL
jgi:hypothetical protein